MKSSVNQSKKDRQSRRTYSEGGSDHMFKAQQAAPKKGGTSGKSDIRGPGAKKAEGGLKIKTGAVGGIARPARAGCTGT
jgi:hypothetical protein